MSQCLSLKRILVLVLDVHHRNINKCISETTFPDDLKFAEVLPIFNPLMPGGNKKVTHTYTNLKLQVCLSMCDLFVTTRH